ncbi:Hypothetical_protein [Hexamita inflata]|uniref:Hypothetical_protein n=1 Tax=Hexamita inflata TaxID=28002 RepID=A0AA86QMR3_9EUKA|nr:Hypothetical protein HINF_LOCUS46271 [Hexamita inflata]
MPYIVHNGGAGNLLIEWVYDNTKPSYNKDQLSEQYSYINIIGSNNSQFDDFEILSRSAQISIINCKIDLSKLYGRFDNVFLQKCQCDNNINSKIDISQLQLNRSIFKVFQLQELQEQCNLSIDTEYDEFDFWNCGLLQCQLIDLNLTGYQITLSQLSGHWHNVTLHQFQLSGNEINYNFSTEQLQIGIDTQTDLSIFNLIQYEEISIYATTKENEQVCDLSQVRNSKVSARIENFVVDVTNYTNYFGKLQLINCKLQGTSNTNQSKLESLNIVISDESKLDLRSLFGVQHQFFTLIIQRISFKQLDIQMCHPTYLMISDCKIDLSVLQGNWKDVNIHSCELTNSNSDCSIVAKNIEIYNPTISDLHCFLAHKVTLNYTQQNIITVFPRAKHLVLVKATINLLQNNNSVERLKIIYSNFQHFSFQQLSCQNIQLVKCENCEQMNKMIKIRNKQLKMNRKNDHRVQNQNFKIKMSKIKRDLVLEKMNQIIGIVQLNYILSE